MQPAQSSSAGGEPPRDCSGRSAAGRAGDLFAPGLAGRSGSAPGALPPRADLLRSADAAMISLNKGLGAPVGAVLVGDDDFIRTARVNVRRLGTSGVHRMGYFAAAALVALDTMQDTFAEEHRRASVLAEALNAIEGLRVDLETVQRRILCDLRS